MDLKKLDIFKAFTPEEIEHFKPLLKEELFAAGQPLFNEGDPGDCLFIIVQGSVRIYKTSAVNDGDEKSLAVLEAGTSLGEMTLLDGAPRSASARAETACLVYRFTREDFMKLLRAYPPAGARLFASFMNALSQRLRQANEELVTLYEVGKVISAAPPLPALLRALLEHTMAGAKAEFGVFFYLNDISEKLEVREAIGPGFELLLDLKTSVKDGIAGIAIRKKSLLKIDDIDSNPEYADVMRLGYERRHMLIAPLSRQDRPFGTILLGDPCGGCPFTGANANLLSAVASQAAAAVEASLLKSDADTKEKFDRHFFRF